MRNQMRRGEGRIGCILWLLVLLAFGFICWKAIPVKIASVELYDFMEEQARRAERVSPEEMRKRIMNRAKELDLPLRKEDVKVRKSGGRILMEVTYTVPLDLAVYTYDWTFHEKVDRAVFIF